MRVHRVVRSSVVLSLAEVRESGRPAFFFDYGEALVYEGDELYDVHDWGTALQIGADLMPLPHYVLEHAVGIEYGWRHAVACDCRACTLQHAEVASADHSTAPSGEPTTSLPQPRRQSIAPPQEARSDSLVA
jgi:hypothetical protein